MTGDWRERESERLFPISLLVGVDGRCHDLRGVLNRGDSMVVPCLYSYQKSQRGGLAKEIRKSRNIIYVYILLIQSYASTPSLSWHGMAWQWMAADESWANATYLSSSTTTR